MVYGRVSLFPQLWREASLGLLIRLTIGGAAWMGLWLLDGRSHVASVVALTIICSSIVATLIASLLPWTLDRLDIDFRQCLLPRQKAAPLRLRGFDFDGDGFTLGDFCEREFKDAVLQDSRRFGRIHFGGHRQLAAELVRAEF